MTLSVHRSQQEDAGSVRQIPPVVSAPPAPPRRAVVASLVVDKSMSHAQDAWLFAPSHSLRRLVRQGEVAYPQDSAYTTARVTRTQTTPRRHPRLAPAGRVRSRTQHQGRGHEVPVLAPKARGRVCIRRGGGAWWLAAVLQRYMQARACCSAPCRPRTAAVVAADGAAGVGAFALWVWLACS